MISDKRRMCMNCTHYSPELTGRCEHELECEERLHKYINNMVMRWARDAVEIGDDDAK